MQTQQEEDTAKEDNKFTKGDDVSIETVDNKVESRGNAKPQAEPEEPAPPRPPAVQKLDCTLGGKHWGDGMVGSVIHEYGPSAFLFATGESHVAENLKRFAKLFIFLNSDYRMNRMNQSNRIESNRMNQSSIVKLRQKK